MHQSFLVIRFSGPLSKHANFSICSDAAWFKCAGLKSKLNISYLEPMQPASPYNVRSYQKEKKKQTVEQNLFRRNQSSRIISRTKPLCLHLCLLGKAMLRSGNRPWGVKRKALAYVED